jgi:hypothetical protein
MIAIVDDNGTPASTADDLSVANGKITYLSGDRQRQSICPGRGLAVQGDGHRPGPDDCGCRQHLRLLGQQRYGRHRRQRPDLHRRFAYRFMPAPSAAIKTTGAWSQAWLGSYGGGLGVTDSSEGSGSNNTHTVDNMGGRDNYVLFEFDQNVVVDSAFLGYVVNDSDMSGVDRYA